MEQQSSFGIKKIVDCKIGEGGQQMYQVKWEPTWEPAENLASCQHLIDEFWSFVNKAKINEKVAQQHRKRMMLEHNSTNNIVNINQNFHRLSNDNKAEIQSMLARTNATSVGSLMSPSNSLMTSQQECKQQNLAMPSSAQKSCKGNISTPSAKVKTDDSFNMDITDSKESKNSAASNAASFKYLENFSSPYVKIIIVCKICNKEAAKNPGNWKVHYLTHLSNEEKPHKCPICNQGFVQTNNLKRHMKKHAKAQPSNDNQNFKTEFLY